MIKPFITHQATESADKTVEESERQRVYDQQTLQDNISASLDPLLALPFLDSVFVEGAVINSSESLVAHKLGRKVRGWILASTNTTYRVYDTIAVTDADLTKFLPLRAIGAGATTVSLIIF